MNSVSVVFLLIVSGQAADQSTWWSLKPIKTNPVPQAIHPIDFFIREKLHSKGLEIGPEAARIALIRRVSLDLTGLPPTPMEINEFVKDPSPKAYEALVDRLLASPRYGERMTRHWLDVARYAETHGHDQDRLRPNAWRYRDWLINAFNRDLPYGDFARAQIAADGFPNLTGADIPALGFLAAGPWDESSLRDIREDSIDREQGRYLDRDDMVSAVGNTFLGMTIQCARCHDHKFDPISQEEYYSLQAVFSGVDKANRAFDEDPSITKKREQLKNRAALLEKKDQKTWDFLNTSENLTLARDLESRSKKQENLWRFLHPKKIETNATSTLTLLQDDSVLASGNRPETEELRLEFAFAGSLGSIRLEVLTHESLPQQGPGRQDNGNLHLSEIEAWLISPKGELTRIPLQTPRADWDQEGWTAAHTIDGNPATAWGIFPKVGVAHQVAYSLPKEINVETGSTLRVVLKQLHGRGHLIGRARLSYSEIPNQALPKDANLDLFRILSKESKLRTSDESRELSRLLLLEQNQKEIAELPEPKLVFAAASKFEPDGSHRPATSPRTIRVLKRGDIRKPGEIAIPGTVHCLKETPYLFEKPKGADDDELWRRVALANWITHPNNSLFWRVMANRIWVYHFGTGIVDTPNDFGKMGGLPSHPELLDWLALNLRDQGGSLKNLHRFIVTSQVYRQAWRDDPKARSIDSSNRFLWRWNRPRLDAEQFRDSLLFASGRLDERRGGPSDQPFEMKPGIHVTPVVDHTKFDWSKGKHRRSVYSLVFRTMPDPFIECLDGADPTASIPRRGESHSPLQALTIWNGDFTLSQATSIAESLDKDFKNPIDRIKKGSQDLWGRSPDPAEFQLLEETAKQKGTVAMVRLLIAANAFAFID